jgi:hypothetical protein
MARCRGPRAGANTRVDVPTRSRANPLPRRFSPRAGAGGATKGGRPDPARGR